MSNFQIAFLSLTSPNFRKVRSLADQISSEEWEAKMLTKKTMELLDLRGSPKLSKVLISLGVSKRHIDMAFSGSSSKTGSRLSSAREDCLDQGNSKHYTSCQRTINVDEWTTVEDLGIHGDEPFLGKELFLWIVGTRFSLNREGFLARAKARVMYTDVDCTEVAGLYIDRPYGQYNVLIEDFQKLRSEWYELSGTETPIFMPPVWNRNDGEGSDFQALYGKDDGSGLFCPSALGGYQDTLIEGYLGPYNFFQEFDFPEPNLVTVYKSREKIGGVYTCSLKDVVYNAQKVRYESPKLKRTRDPLVNWSKYSIIVKGFMSTVGMEIDPKTPLRIEDTDIESNIYFRSQGQMYILSHNDANDGKLKWFFLSTLTEEQSIIYYNFSRLTVERNHGDFHVAVPLPYDMENSTLLVRESLAEYGFEVAEMMPLSRIDGATVVDKRYGCRNGFCPAVDLNMIPYMSWTSYCYVEARYFTYKIVDVPGSSEDWWYVEGFMKGSTL